MIKVKLIEANDLYDLQEQINSFISSEGVTVLTIKHRVTPPLSPYNAKAYYSAMIAYEAVEVWC